uniref:Uncharacterized protein n=1 Tax=Phlebotomus kandelakii TaxID=1109342 RepID=A0A6B2EK24_9DIPT
MTVSKIQMAQPAIVKRNPDNRSIPNGAGMQRSLQTQSNRPNPRRCLFERPAPGENQSIAETESNAILLKKNEEYEWRYGFNIITGRPVEESSDETSATERLQEPPTEEAASVDAGDNAKAECSAEVKDTVKKAEDMCNGDSARNPGKETSSAERSHRVKPYVRATKRTHITDYMKEVKKPSRSSIESKEKH